MIHDPWRAPLELALHRNRRTPQSRFVQLATVRLDGRPAVRTVVFRGFLGNSSELVFTTDARSAKRAELARRPDAELCWFFPETREQFRLSGAARVVDGSMGDPGLREARETVWRDLPEPTRASFAWPTPGTPRALGAPFPSPPTTGTDPPEAFALIVFTAHEVDLLELDGDPQNRWRYLLDEGGDWSVREVNP